MSVNPQKETLGFQTQVNQLLKLVAENLYSNKEVFMRELVSNASDAADKLRYLALGDEALYEGHSELAVKVSFDADKKTITISDNGIGMTRQDAIEHLGTIAKSGTQAFSDMLKNDTSDKKTQHKSELIGQFGVGFYSAFVVADTVEVNSRRAGMQPNEGVKWVSTGDGEFTVSNIEKTDRGTEIILHVKKSAEEFLNDYRLREMIRQYSDHIMIPVMMKKQAEPEASSDESDEKKSEKKNQAPEWERVNQANALWTLPKADITDAQYQDLYKHITHDYRNALAWSHNRVEGKLEYTSLLYIPENAPFDLWNREGLRGLKLYVKRVFIMDDAEHFMPMYLRFVKGIIDTNDLPLNVSRELLQSNDVINKIKSASVKKILGLLEKLAKDEPSKYATFWKAFGQVLKEGPAEDFSNKEDIAKLLRFCSTHSSDAEQTVSLQDYLSRMKDKQDKIYYLIADNYTAAHNSPLLEAYRQKGVEVLLMTDRVDEWLMGHLNEFEGKQFISIAKGDFDLDDEKDDEVKKEEKKKQEGEFGSLLKQMKDYFGDRVNEVRLTSRLTDSPACVVFGADEMSGHLQRLMQQAGQAIQKPKPILELNPKHPLILRVQSETDDARVGRWADLLLGQSLLAEGEALENPAQYVKDMNALLLDISK
jgi:molecular chaperone HtpG